MATCLPSPCLVCEKDGDVTVTLVRDQPTSKGKGKDPIFCSMATMEMMCYRYGGSGYGMWRNRNKANKWERCLERMRKMCEEFTDQDVQVTFCSKCWTVFENQDTYQDVITSFALGVGDRILALAGEEPLKKAARVPSPPPPPLDEDDEDLNRHERYFTWSVTGGINLTRRGSTRQHVHIVRDKSSTAPVKDAAIMEKPTKEEMEEALDRDSADFPYPIKPFPKPEELAKGVKPKGARRVKVRRPAPSPPWSSFSGSLHSYTDSESAPEEDASPPKPTVVGDDDDTSIADAMEAVVIEKPVPKPSFTTWDKDRQLLVLPAPIKVTRDMLSRIPIATASPIVDAVVMERPVPKPRLSLIKKALEEKQFSTKSSGYHLLPVNFFQDRVRNQIKSRMVTFPNARLDSKSED